MAKGDYKSKYGGSKSGYLKGFKHALIIIGIVAVIVFVIYLIIKKYVYM